MPLSDEELLELSGEEQLEDIQDIILRNRGLTTEDLADLVARLPSLVSCSLSHNLLGDAQCIASLQLLEHLNISFNALTSVQGLGACVSLRRLYLSNNRIRDISPLEPLGNLEVLSLFRNDLSSLDFTLATLGHMPFLRELDLEANPCSRTDDYRPRVLAALPSLEKLDSEPVNAVDEELIGELAPDLRASVQLPPRPSTASAPSFQRPSSARPPSGPLASRLLSQRTPSISTSSAGEGTGDYRPSTAPTTSPPRLGRPQTARPTVGAVVVPTGGNTRLFHDDFLDKNPILMEYLAAEIVAPPKPSSAGTGASTALNSQRSSSAGIEEGAGASNSMGKRQSFADRLRSTAATLNAVSKTTSAPGSSVLARPSTANPAAGRSALGPGFPSTSVGKDSVRDSVAGFPSAVGGGALTKEGVERSLVAGASPMEMVRILLSKCEQLQREKDTLMLRLGKALSDLDKAGVVHPSASAASTTATESELAQKVAALQRENARLQLENKNMFWLSEENQRLKGELEEARLQLQLHKDEAEDVGVEEEA